MKLLLVIFFSLLEVIPSGKASLRQLQQRDSILIADQIEYGITLDNVKEGTSIALPDLSKASSDTLCVVEGWKIDTLATKKAYRKKGAAPLRAHIVLAPFEEGKYRLPDIPVLVEGDTLLFEGVEMDVKTMPVDTATYQIHDIKPQMRYPLRAAEVIPWVGLAFLGSALIILAVCLVRRRRRLSSGESVHRDPAYIVALRALDKYRSDKFWAPEKQKAFYSGITDTLKTYIDERFCVDAPEMTTAELFAALKSRGEITPELYSELKEMFELSDFVKFAKHTASDEQNAKALPLAVRFVTSTYQSELEAETEAAKK